MTFTFVHTADWQIGKPFGRFDGEKAPVLRKARIDAIDRIADVARQAGAAHVLVAGDVFDGELADRHTSQTMMRLAGHSGLTWHLLPGNHDPARRGGLWDAIRSAGTPANVRLHLASESVMIEPGIALLPAPLASKSVSVDPTAWMDQATTPPGVLRIGLAHGSVQGFGSLGEAAVPLDARRSASAGLAYMALGDWHGAKRINERTFYSGTPEPDSFQDNGPGHVLVVRIEGIEAPPAVQQVRTAEYTWLGRRIVLAREADLTPLESEIRTLASPARTLMDLSLEGMITAADLAGLETRLERLEAAVYHLGIDRRLLRIGATSADIEVLEAGALRRIAERLQTQVTAGDPARQATAERALALLFRLANQSGVGGSR